jgi:hypothetical protein
VEKALATTRGQIGLLKNTLDQKKKQEQAIIRAASGEDLTKIRARALVMMNEIKNDLSKNIKAVSTGGKMRIQTTSSLRSQIRQIDSGIREIEKATTSERVGMVLARIRFDGEQLKLLDHKLNLRGRRGSEMARAVADKEVAHVKHKTLTLMKIIKRDLNEQIKVKGTSAKMKIHSLNELQAQLRIVNEGIRKVEKAGSSDRITQVLATVQHDLGDIGTLVTRKRKRAPAERKVAFQPVRTGSPASVPKSRTHPDKAAPATAVTSAPVVPGLPGEVKSRDRRLRLIYMAGLALLGLVFLNLLINIYLFVVKRRKNH